jgi:2-aminoethylphosphonate dioxygenase
LISQADVETFRREGFVIKRNFLGAEEARQIAIMTDEIARWPEVAGKYMMYFETSLTRPGERLLSRMENFFPYHAGFQALLTGPKLLGGATWLFGEPAVLFKDKINFKLSGADGFKAHQDVQAGWEKYANLHITAMVTIDVAILENGYLEIACGHHRRGSIGRKWEPLTDADTNGMAFVPCITGPGDVVFFDSYTPHRSGPNLSANPRRVLYITYNRRSEGDCRLQYYADKRKSYPPDCERVPARQYSYKV